MKKIISIILSAVLLLCLFTACQENNTTDNESDEKFGKVFYVSVDGSDENDGTKTAPLATLNEAVEKLKSFISENGLPEGGIKVEIASGNYKIKQTTVIPAEISGEEGKPIVFAAEKDGTVTLDGSADLDYTKFSALNDCDGAEPERIISPEAKNNVVVYDLSAVDLYDAPAVHMGGSGTWEYMHNTYRQELFVNGERQTLSRYPNDGFVVYQATDATTYTSTIHVPDEKFDIWSKHPEDVVVSGYPGSDWNMFFLASHLVSWNETTRTLDIINCPNCHDGDVQIYMLNSLEELDSPGEYFIDYSKKLLYWWPDTDINSAKINFSVLEEAHNIIDLDGCSFVTIKGLNFVYVRNRGIYSTAPVSDVTVEKCSFFDFASAYCVALDGKRITVKDSDFENLGAGAIAISGGDSAGTLEPSESVITNNHIKSFQKLYSGYNPAITCKGSGFIISHNTAHDSPHSAILLNGNTSNTIIEYNEFYDLCREISDGGAIYIGHNWQGCSNIIRYNLIYDVKDLLKYGGGNGIYLDDSVGIQQVYGNILVNIGGNGITTGGGRHIDVHHNFLANVEGDTIYMNDNGINWQAGSTVYGQDLWLGIIDYWQSDIWRYAYPEKLTMVELDETENLDRVLDCAGNICYCTIADNASVNPVTAGDGWENHIYWNPMVRTRDSVWKYGEISNNLIYNNYDMFVDYQNGDYHLREDAQVYRDIIGFEKVDMSAIGCQR